MYRAAGLRPASPGQRGPNETSRSIVCMAPMEGIIAVTCRDPAASRLGADELVEEGDVAPPRDRDRLPVRLTPADPQLVARCRKSRECRQKPDRRYSFDAWALGPC